MSGSEEALLRRAAKTVRERGKAATRGPWQFDGETGGNEEQGWPSECSVLNAVPVNPRGVRRSMTVVASGVADENVDTERDYLMPDDAAWIALVGPQLAEPLAAWLETAARFVEASRSGGMPIHPLTLDALDLARTLLGETAVPATAGDDHQEKK